MKSRGNFWYYLAFLLYVLVFFLDRTTFENILFVSAKTVVTATKLLCLAILFLRLLMLRFEPKPLIAIVVIGVMVAGAMLVSRDWNLILLYMFVITGNGISVKRLAAIALVAQLVMIALAIIFALAGAIETIYTYRIVDHVLQSRSALGFKHPNQFGQAILAACFSYAALRFPHFRAVDIIPHIVGATACYVVANSLTSAACIMLVAVLAFFSQFIVSKNAQQRVSILMAAAIVVLAAATYYLMVNYNSASSWMYGINSLLSQRFSLAHAYFLEYPPKLLGYDVSSIVITVGNFVQHGPDSAYVRILIQDGWLMTAAFLAVYGLTLFNFIRHKRYDACVFGLLIYAVIAVMECNMLYFATNYCLIGASALVFGWEQYERAYLGEDSLLWAKHLSVRQSPSKPRRRSWR